MHVTALVQKLIAAHPCEPPGLLDPVHNTSRHPHSDLPVLSHSATSASSCSLSVLTAATACGGHVLLNQGPVVLQLLSHHIPIYTPEGSLTGLDRWSISMVFIEDCTRLAQGMDSALHEL